MFNFPWTTAFILVTYVACAQIYSIYIQEQVPLLYKWLWQVARCQLHIWCRLILWWSMCALNCDVCITIQSYLYIMLTVIFFSTRCSVDYKLYQKFKKIVTASWEHSFFFFLFFFPPSLQLFLWFLNWLRSECSGNVSYYGISMFGLKQYVVI